ncbi:MAG: hypothetical protein ABH878_09315 [bacterium]
MKSKTVLTMIFAGVAVAALIIIPRFVTCADDSEPSPTPVVASTTEPGLPTETEFASSDDDDYNPTSYRREMKDLARQYRKARSEDERNTIAQRMDRLMSDLFEARIQMEHRRIEVLERRVMAEKQRIQDMQDHKTDLVHRASQRALESGEFPDWASKQSD